MNILIAIVTSLLLDTTFTEAYVQGHFGQSTMPIGGVQDGGFSVQAHSVYDINDVSRVFGEAGYTWGQSEGNRWVENADYELLYPYLTCDTIGGGMRSEQYWFRGGYRMAKNHIIWHLALQYRALQSYRSIDPRPKNKVADLCVEGSVGYFDDRYAYSAVGYVGRYKQNNDISFYSELGNAMVYHLVQPNQDYMRFAGGFTSSYYHGLNVGGGLQIQPFQHGWLAGAEYRYVFITKELNNSTFTPIAQLCTHTMAMNWGYAAPEWRAILQADYTMRLGTQYIYGDVTGNYYHLLMKSNNYHEQQLHVVAKGDYSTDLPIGYMTFAANIGYLHKFTSKMAEETRFNALAAYLSASYLDAHFSIRYTFPIKARYSWFFEPAATYTHYFSSAAMPIPSATFGWQTTLKTGVSF